MVKESQGCFTPLGFFDQNIYIGWFFKIKLLKESKDAKYLSCQK